MCCIMANYYTDVSGSGTRVTLLAYGHAQQLVIPFPTVTALDSEHTVHVPIK